MRKDPFYGLEVISDITSFFSLSVNVRSADKNCLVTASRTVPFKIVIGLNEATAAIGVISFKPGIGATGVFVSIDIFFA